MTQATTTHTNTPRRAHPVAVRAALRSRGHHSRTCKGYSVVIGPLFHNNIHSKSIGEKSNLTNLEQYYYKVTLRQSAVSNILAGEATFKEINRVTFVE